MLSRVPEDEGAEPYGFALNGPDDGLGDGLVCPGDAPRSRLTDVGYLTAAAHRCRVALKESSALADAIEVAISLGDYGDGAEARVLFNDARQRGFSEGTSQADCAKVAASIRDYSRELLKP